MPITILMLASPCGGALELQSALMDTEAEEEEAGFIFRRCPWTLNKKGVLRSKRVP